MIDMSTYKRAKYKENVPWVDIPDPVATKKYDGSHFVLEVGPLGDPHFISRRESVKGHYPERTDKLPHLTSTPVPQLSGNVYSVELIHSGHSKDAKESHASCSGILNSLPPKAIETQARTGPIRAVLLDVVSPVFPTYQAKMEHLQEVQRAFNKPDLIFTPSVKIGKAEVQKEIERTKREGEEGVIVTSLTKPESENYRVKVKHKDTYNLKVVGITQEIDIHGTPKESAGALIVADGTGQVVANVGTGLSRDLRREIWLNKKAWMNKLIQVEAMKTTARKLRSPVYNGDADGGLDTI